MARSRHQFPSLQKNMAKIKLNNKQKIQVEQWQSKLCLASQIIQVIDRTCGYRDVLLKWKKSSNQPNNQIAIVNYITRLVLCQLLIDG